MSEVTQSRSGQFFEAGVSHCGVVRTENEDAFLSRGGEGFWMVADGMGGLDDGQWASRTLAMRLAEAPLSGDLERDAATVGECVRHANFDIFRESTERGTRIGSTVVSLLVRGSRFAAIWAGDSRLYLRRDGALQQVTVDHTQVQQMLAAGYISAGEAADHPMAHVLARAVGTHAEVEAEVVAGEVQVGDIFLLCSDGLPRVVEDHEIARALEAGNPGQMVRRLLDLALERGAPDNVTILVVGCADPTGAVAGVLAPSPPVLGGAAAGPAPPASAQATAASPPKPPAAADRKRGGGGAMLSAVIALLVLGALGVGAWLAFSRPRHAAASAAPPLAAQSQVPVDAVRQFEGALATVACSSLQIEKLGVTPAGVDLAVTGVAASPASVQSALQAAAVGARVQLADIDTQAVAAAPPTLCSTLDALRPFRATTSETGQDLVAAQDSFAVMKQADGKVAGRAVVTATPPPQGDFALVELGADNSLTALAADRQGFLAMAGVGTVVTKVPDGGGYRLQADYAKAGWSSVILITGRGPFPRALLTQPAGPRSAAWASQFASAAQAGGWRVEAAWYDITTGGDLSVIPESQAASNALLAPGPTNALVVAKPPKAPAANAIAAPEPAANSAATSAPASAKPAGKPPPAAEKSDVPL